MQKSALALLLTLTLAGCGTQALPGGVPARVGDSALGARAAAGAATPLARFEALAEKYVDGFKARSAAERAAAVLDAADYDSPEKPAYSDKALTAAKVSLIEKYLKAIATAKLKPEAVTMGILGSLKDHADYAFPERGTSIYADGSAAHLRIFKQYVTLVERYEVRQQAIAVSWFLGTAYGAKNGGSEQGVAVLESYLEALDKAGFAVRSEKFAVMSHSGQAGLDGLLRTMSFEFESASRGVGPALSKKLLPKVVAALKGKERTATADLVNDTLKDLAAATR